MVFTKKVLLTIFSLIPVFYSSAQTADRQIISTISTKKYTEFAPTISADGRTMIFESNQQKDWKLYQSHLDKHGRWSEPFPITAVNDKLNFLAGPSLSYDGNTLFFTGFIEEVSTSEDIFYSTRIDDKTWSEPVRMDAPINTDGYEGFPSISADAQSLYFIRANEENFFDKKSKENCFHIYVSHKNSDGTWAEPALLPPSINSGCVRDPRIMADNSTLIFSAIKPGGKGKYDLYLTRKTGSAEWTEPVPLDFINSESNDQSICIAASGDVMFFYSNEDIYSIAIPKEYRQMINVTVQGYVREETTGKPLKAEIVVKSLTTDNTFTSSSQASDGRYSVVLSAGHQYEIKFISSQHIPFVQHFDLVSQNEYTEIKKDISLQDKYKIKIDVKDKDLSKPVPAFVHVVGEDGRTVMNDSVKIDTYPFEISLRSGSNYRFSVSSPQYIPETLEWKFDAATYTPETSYTFSLEHHKVAYTADVVNVVSNQQLKTKVYFKNEEEDEIIVAEAGETVYLRDADRYQIVTSSDKGYIFSSITIQAKEHSEPDVPKENRVLLKVTPIEAGAHVTLDHIGFDLNSAELMPVSYLTLQRVVELMQKNPTVNIQISAHTDDVGDDAYNQKLSERRALTIVRYLYQNGIAFARMRPVGYGEKKPLMPNDSEENRALNRRVELDIIRD